MPYVTQKERDDIARPPLPGETAEIINCSQIATPGQLNYAITRLMINYMKYQGERYQSFNDVMGALTGAQQEFYRRHIAPYEDMKKDKNGDVQ